MSDKGATLDALKIWRESLVGLNRRSRLIRFKPPKTSSLTFDLPAPDEILALLRSGQMLDFYGDLSDEGDGLTSVPAPRRNAFHVPRPHKEIGPVVRTLMRRANEEFLDRGLSVLYVSFGMLRWKDTDGSDMASPLYLVPVELVPEGPRATPRLKATEVDHVLNPALPLRLSEFGVQWPTLDDMEDLGVTGILDVFRDAIAKADDFSGWEILSETHLATFSFSKEAMYKDLIDNEEMIAEHAVVQALANTDPTSQTDVFQFDPINPGDIDEIAPPEKTPLILDADSSQRAAVAAALAGRSFVMDGPPGTGKSQTIANMIGAFMHAGKSVLFVSEKIAALDVVRNRLQDAGLGSYLLELHSHKTNRREVATELMKTLDNVAQPPVGMSAPSRAMLEDRRRKLTAYAMAMNETRSPLQLSLHDVLGILAGLVNVAAAPVPDRPPLALDQAGLASLHDTLSRLERTWRPAAQGASFLWRDVVDESSLETRIWTANSALQELKGTLDLNAGLASAFELDSLDRAQDLALVLNLQHSDRPRFVNEEWLSSHDWVTIESDRLQLVALVENLQDRAAEVVRLSGMSYAEFSKDAPEIPVTPRVLSPIDMRALTSPHLHETIEFLQHHADGVSRALHSLTGLARESGLPAPATWAEADRVIRLVELRNLGSIVEPSWLTAGGLQSAKDAAATMRLKAIALDSAEERVQSIFRPEALTAPLRDLRDRFDNLHKGIRKLSGDYRRDKQSVALLLSDANQVKLGISRLSDAVSWSEASQEFEAASLVQSRALGRQWKGRKTDWDAFERSFATAEEVIALAPSDVTDRTVAFFTTEIPEPAHYEVAVGAREALHAWRQYLAQPPNGGGHPELVVEPIETSLMWISAHLAPMEQALSLVTEVNAVNGRNHLLSEAEAILLASEAAHRAAGELEAAGLRLTRQFQGLFRGVDTDLAEVDTALSWVLKVRELAPGGTLSERQVDELKKSTPIEALPRAISRWEEARDSILGAFAESRRSELLADCATFEGASELLAELGDDTVGQQEWFDYKLLRDELRKLDLDSTVEFCIRHRLQASEVPKVVERALLRAWSDAQIQEDQRLHPLKFADREALVKEFKTLDLELTAAATGDIIRAANTRRPLNTSFGGPALIRREGMKQRRHMPVRSLISSSRSAIQAIKPVFMMSPLAVSQYLPPDIKFDVVIFDEASQVTPGDSINCIYRGHSFILAGDDKQLPPTQFFERAIESDDETETDADVQDFQSILELAKSAGAFQNLGLRWHYRSRHEALIAFSNYRFYEGKLVTYPSAQEDGADVGIELFSTEGLYRRGGGADNPREARVVAERVIHHYRTRPNSSLGVVTFSVAQASAVIAAVDELRGLHRDLDGYFDRSDRLDGFFVRSLESVQGDERDVIIFSIGYGPDEAGKISTNFGVLNKEKGWRRLNVGVTRARQRVEVVSSMDAHDIPPSRNENVEALRAYLDFAKRGISVLGTQSSVTGLMPESPFEEAVIHTIRSWGYSVEPQVGAAGFRIDLAVRHPAKPGMFALGVECDGYQYHSSPAARDRDRLRDQVLEGLGWTLHRIWGTAWYRDRANEEQRLRVAIERAVSGRDNTSRPTPTALTRPEIETTPAQTLEAYAWTAEYEQASPVRLASYVEPGERGSHLYMVDAMVTLAQVEGPVHMDVISERIREWWQVGRVSQRVKKNLKLAIEIAGLQRNGDFVDVPNRPVSKVRCHGDSRKPEQVDLREFALAAEYLVDDVGSAPRQEVVTQIARLFGWARNGAILDERLNRAIDMAVATGKIAEEGAVLRTRSFA